MNAQNAEDTYQLKREYYALKKQFEEKNIDKTVINNGEKNTSDPTIEAIEKEELETLRETVIRLTLVSIFNMHMLFFFFFMILSSIYRKIVIYNPLHILK